MSGNPVQLSIAVEKDACLLPDREQPFTLEAA